MLRHVVVRLIAVSLILTGTLTWNAVSSPIVADPPTADAATQLESMFSAYGDTSGAWSGADGTASVELQNGSIAWLFSDTYLGEVGADHSRPASAPMINNSIVLQTGAEIDRTLTGGTIGAPAALLAPTSDGQFFWVGDGTATTGGTLAALYNRYRFTGQGVLDLSLQGTSLAVIDTDSGTVTDLSNLPLGSRVAWGSEILEVGNTTYVYGSEYVAGTGMRFAHLARTSSDLSGPWQFWDGSDWSSTEADSARLISGVGTAFAVQQSGPGYVLVTQEANGVFHPGIVAYTSPTPWGPFTGPTTLYRAPEVAQGHIAYDARLHPELASPGKLLVSYNVNTLTAEENYADARIYRPRFLEVAWPAPVGDPGTSLPAPTLSATPTEDGNAELSWTPVAGADQYWVYQRDLTAGQTHPMRLPEPVAGTSMLAGLMRSGHQYEYAVSASGPHGEGHRSLPATVTVTVVPPVPPTSVTATPDTTGGVVVSWDAVPGSWNYEVFYRNVSANETDYVLATRTSGAAVELRVGDLIEGDTYEFTVRTHTAGGVSAHSTPVSAVPDTAPPTAPTGLTATATATGTINLSWTASPDSWYWVEQRDVTAEQTEFTRLPLPVSTTSMVASYLTHLHEYEFRVVAYHSGGESTPSGLAAATSRFPDVPRVTGVQAVARDGSVDLSWSSLGESFWYQVYFRDQTAGETEFQALPSPVAGESSLNVGHLVNGHTYEFRVAGLGSAGTGPQSVGAFATPLPPVPTQVTGIAAAALANGRIRLTWTAQPNSYYWVYMRDVTSNQAWTKLPLPADKASFEASYLTHGHNYEFRVAATNLAGDGPLSVVVARTSTYAKPTAPTNLTGRAAGNATIVLDWDEKPDVYFFIYIKDVTAGETTFTPGVYPTDQSTVRLELMKHNHVYDLKVLARNTAGDSPFSNTVRVTAVGGLPSAPSNLTATAQDGQVALSWQASPTANVMYRVYQRDVTIGQQSFRPWDLPINARTATAQYLTNGHTYEFKVAAVSSIGEGHATPPVSARPMPPVPSSPSGLTASPGDGFVDLAWSGSGPGVEYVVQMRSNGSNWGAEMITINRWLKVTYLTNGTSYEFRVRARNVAGTSNSSNIVAARPLPPVPLSASNLVATPGDARVQLNWDASPTPGVWYNVQYKAGSGQWVEMPYPVQGGTKLLVQHLGNGVTYRFRIRAFNAAGNSSWATSATVKPMPPLPSPPASFEATERPGSLRLTWTPRPSADWYYAVYITNLTTGTTKRAQTASNGSWDYGLTPGTAYKLEIASINVSGEGTTRRAISGVRVPRIFWYGSRPQRFMNVHNGGNAVASAIAAPLACKNGQWQQICFGYSPAGNRPMVIGDTAFYPGSENDLHKLLRCEAIERAQMVRDYGRQTADAKGPNLLRHEAAHSEQSASYSHYELWAAAYGAAELAKSQTGGINHFEQAANAWHGGYGTPHPGVQECAYVNADVRDYD